MAKTRINEEFAFFNALYYFVQNNKWRVRKKYQKLSRHMLDFNDPDLRADAYLRRPQFEALEMYVFLKEFAENRHVHQVFSEWAKNEGIFENYQTTGVDMKGQGTLLGFLDLAGDEQYKALFAKMSERARSYPNYIFALTMGLGKTILMATCVFYEFLLANKFSKDAKYCQNALVFAPDKTVLQSLKEIQTFDLSLVVPPEYANFLRTNMRFHFLDDAASTIGAQDGSSFNIIISNTQKIILRRVKAELTATDKLFAEKKGALSEVYGDLYGMLGEDTPETDADLAVNARFQKIARLPQLGIYVDEAHHSMGAALERDLGQAKQNSALRTTIDELSRALEARKTGVVGCYNFTGTPYVKDRIMPEVVYAYGLKAAIDNKYLKQPDFFTYTGNIKSDDFVREVITDFWTNWGESRHEGMLPKLALFASTIRELEGDLRPSIETVLAELGVSTDKILTNVGDSKLTTNEDIREFNRLDTGDSSKQFILLVGKGGEGWNCRSLFGVALYRKPKSRIFVLQSTMRCLRAIGPRQEGGRIYLSAENQAILDDELQQNFRVTTDELGPKNEDTSVTVEVTAVPPPVIIKLRHRRELYQTVKKDQPDEIVIDLSNEAMEQYRIKLERRTRLKGKAASIEDITERQSRKIYTKLTLIGELARYFFGDGISAFDIEERLEDTNHGLDVILQAVNAANDIVFDVLVPCIFHAFFEVEKFCSLKEEEVELIRGYNDNSNRPLPSFTFKAQDHLIQRRDQKKYDGTRSRSFHLDTYCFDSAPEVEFFDRVIKDVTTEKIYFTGMLSQGQSGFQVYYVHPESRTVCNYHPDFLVYRTDGKAHLIEIKSNWKKNDPVVLAKKSAAERLAAGNHFEYSLVTKEQFDSFLKPDGWDAYEPEPALDE